jgi:hypothetical protein
MPSGLMRRASARLGTLIERGTLATAVDSAPRLGQPPAERPACPLSPCGGAHPCEVFPSALGRPTTGRKRVPGGRLRGTVVAVALFLRAFEEPDGMWTCRQGNRAWDSHQSLEEAVSHLREIADALEGPVLVIAHRIDGRIDHLDEIVP